MAVSKARATWSGRLSGGRGTMSPEHGGEIAYSAGTRFEGQAGSNPEELIGAALAGCFSMALALGLEKAGAEPVSVRTSAGVALEKTDQGFTITAIDLDTEVEAKGLDGAKLQEVAEKTKTACPVSRALAAIETITVEARLVSP